MPNFDPIAETRHIALSGPNQLLIINSELLDISRKKETEPVKHTTRHEQYAVSQMQRKLMEEDLG